MENNFENSEKTPIERKEVFQRLKEYGLEDAQTVELLTNWVSQEKEKVRTIVDLREQMRADFAFEIEKIELYIQSGLIPQAKEELLGSDGVEGMIDVAINDFEREQVQRLLEEIERVR